MKNIIINKKHKAIRALRNKHEEETKTWKLRKCMKIIVIWFCKINPRIDVLYLLYPLYILAVSPVYPVFPVYPISSVSLILDG